MIAGARIGGMTMVTRVAAISIVFGLTAFAFSETSLAQTREKGPWWPSSFGPTDQAGATNYITPAKVLKAVQAVKTGQMYELGLV